MTDVIVGQPVVLKSLAGVELVAVGTWRISTGEATFTAEDLADAVSAMDCPGIRNPVLKLGHAEEDSTGGIRWDGEPAVGWVENLRLTDNGAKILGDFRGVPAWLMDVMPSAYPDRSVELRRNFRCQIGHYHPAVITALALLGVNPPGVGVLKSLQDVQALFTEQARVALALRVGGRVVFASAPTAPPQPEPEPVPIRVGDRVVFAKFDPNQPRDSHGRWGDGLGGMTDAELLKGKPWTLNRTEVYSDDAELQAWRLLESYRAEEAEVTPQLEDLAKRNGGHMAGLAHKLKTQESLARKLEHKSAAKGLTVQQYGAKIGDALRYTMIARGDDNYASTAQAAIDDFRSQGYEVEVENTWQPGASYKGINTNMIKDGLRFEVQFHSPTSITAKHKQHGLYTIARNTKASPEERAQATAEMLANAAAVETPPGADGVK